MKLSVCMATYNGARYVEEQLTSILRQLGPDDEVVVVDDASTDRTVEAVRGLGDARVRLHRNERNQGPIRTFERALGLAEGDVIFFADQDDVWEPEKVERFRVTLAEGPVDCVVSDATVVDQDLRPLGVTFFAGRRAGPGALKNFYKNTYLGCCMAITRRARSWILPFPAHIVQHDEWIGMSCEIVSGVRFLPVPLIKYRRHGSSVTTGRRFRMDKVLRNRVKYLYAIATALPRLLAHRARLRRERAG